MKKKKSDNHVAASVKPIVLYFKSDKVIDFVSTATKVPAYGLNMYETSVMITFSGGSSLWAFQSFGIAITFSIPVRYEPAELPENILIPIHLLSSIVPCIEECDELEISIIGDEIFASVYGGSVDVHGQVNVDDSPYGESFAIIRDSTSSKRNTVSIDIKALVEASKLLSLAKSNSSPQHRLLYLSEDGAAVFTTSAAAHIGGKFLSTSFTAKGINVLHGFVSVVDEGVVLTDTECNMVASSGGDSLILCKATDTLPFTISRLFTTVLSHVTTVSLQRLVNIFNILHVAAESDDAVVSITFHQNGLTLSMPRYQVSSPSSFYVGEASAGKTLHEVKAPIDAVIKAIVLLRRDTEIGISYADTSVYFLGSRIKLAVFGCS
jgi:hypothetical protein